MTVLQHVSFLCIYELSVLMALQAASLSQQDAKFTHQSHQAHLTHQAYSLIHHTASLTHQEGSYIRQESSLTHHDLTRLTHQNARLPYQLTHQDDTIHQPISLRYQDTNSFYQFTRSGESLTHQAPSVTNKAASVKHRTHQAVRMSPRTYQGGRFSITSLMDSITLPPLPSMFTSGATKCQALKSFLGLTYEQMQEKNSSKFYESLTIDLITKDGNEKYNFTSTKRLANILKDAKEIIVLVHGFLESSDGAMVQALAMEFLKKSGLEILALDGRKVINFEYFRSTTYARFMGEKLGHVLSDIVKEDIDPSKFTLIGHSLGAHIAGIAGMRVYQLAGKLVGRVIGLDPAGPCFANVSADNRLDKSDAEFVDVIHTNAGILGINEAVGHKDFYPSGGKSQPGCLLSTCDHSKAWLMFAESINFPDHFPARKCANWTSFKDGLCAKNELAYMGVSSDQGSPGQYFLNVAPTPPYGLGPAGSGR